jgi:hypothetical protein
VDDRTLDYPLEPGGRLRVLPPVRDEVHQFRLDIFDEVAAQRVEFDVAGPHHGGRILIVDQREEQMLKRRVFVPAFAGERQSAMEGLFKAA